MKNRFGTFEGVFTPCLLSILGVIMYLRLSWVVGQVGFIGTVLIICFANFITLATALSMSSVVTNIRIGAGGAYSIISKSLGAEAGGAIGIPLYISQSISVAFYIAGFSECWRFVYPHHDGLMVSLITWFILLIITYASAKLAFKIQFVILGVILLSLISIFLGKVEPQPVSIFVQSFTMGDFWKSFAIFFPAVTGILAGASMSGELTEPRTNIPKGTLSAIGVSFIIYILLAYWFSVHVSQYDLLTSSSVAVNIGRWKWAVILGIMGATVSSGLGMFISSPRVLLALGKHRLIPFSRGFKFVNSRGEPTTAILFTALIALLTILMGSLDQIASLLTMFFLITYGMINLTVFIEQSIGIASFRPTFRVSRWITFLGSLGCVAVMLLIDVKFSAAAILVIIVMYVLLLRREAKIYSPDIRSGALQFIAEEFAKAASRLPYYPKIWKPNLLIPVNDIDQISQYIPLIRGIAFPAGRITFFKIISRDESKKQIVVDSENRNFMQVLLEQLSSKLLSLKDDGMFIESAIVPSENELEGSLCVMHTLRNMFFLPNALFSVLQENSENDGNLCSIIEEASVAGLGIITLYIHPKVGLSRERLVNLWIRRQSPNVNLSILIALQLHRNWEGGARIIQVVDKEYEKKEAEVYLNKMKDIMRIPLDVDIEVLVGDFFEVLKQASPADINIFGMQEKPDLQNIRKVANTVQTSVLFLKDSQYESALA